MPQQNSHTDPLTGLYHADPMWRRYQPKPPPVIVPDDQQFDEGSIVTGPDPAIVPDDRQFTGEVKVSTPVNDMYPSSFPDVKLPNVMSPRRDLPEQLPVTAPPPPSTYGAIRGLAPASIHKPSAGDIAAVAGLKGAQYQDNPSPIEVPHRNQAAAQYYANKYGLGPEGANGSISEQDLRNLDTAESEFPHMIERMKAGSPLQVAQLQGNNSLAMERLRGQNQQQLENSEYDRLQQFLGSGLVEPGTAVTMGKSSFRTAAPNAMLPTGVGKPAEQALIDAYKKLNGMPEPNSFGRMLGSPNEIISGKSQEQQRDELKAEIQRLEQQLHLPPGGGARLGGGQTPPAGAAPIRKPIPDGSGTAESTDGGRTWHRVQ